MLFRAVFSPACPNPFKHDYLPITILRNVKLIHKGIRDNEKTHIFCIDKTLNYPTGFYIIPQNEAAHHREAARGCCEALACP